MMNIGQAAAASGVSAKMIRYYESTGLIAAPRRTVAGYRTYSSAEIEALRFVRRARDLGFSTAQIETLLALWRDQTRASSEVKQIALDHVAELRAKMRQIEEMALTLEHLAEHCHGDARPDCPILADLSGHGASCASAKVPR